MQTLKQFVETLNAYTGSNFWNDVVSNAAIEGEEINRFRTLSGDATRVIHLVSGKRLVKGEEGWLIVGQVGRKPEKNALRRTGKRLPLVRPELVDLLDTIVTNRGGTRGDHIQAALILYATIEEAEAAGLVE